MHSPWQGLVQHQVLVGPGLPLPWRCPAEQSAAAPELLFIPGIASDSRSWYRQSPLSRRAPLAFFDNPLDVPDAPYCFEILALLLRDAVYELCDRPPILIGSSFGGMVALMYAILWPDALSGLVLSGSAADGRWFPYPIDLGYHLLRYVPDSTFVSSFPFFARLSGYRDRQDAQVRDLFCEQGRQFVPRLYGKRLRAIARLRLQDRLGEVRVPTLVLHGSLDRSIPLWMGQAMADGIPGATLRIAQGGTHNIHLNRAEWFNEQVRDWAGRHGPTACEPPSPPELPN